MPTSKNLSKIDKKMMSQLCEHFNHNQYGDVDTIPRWHNSMQTLAGLAKRGYLEPVTICGHTTSPIVYQFAEGQSPKTLMRDYEKDLIIKAGNKIKGKAYAQWYDGKIVKRRKDLIFETVDEAVKLIIAEKLG